MKLTAVFQKVPEGYIGFVEELPGANTQAPTLEEARESLSEAVQLVLEANRALSEESMEGKEVIREPLVICDRMKRVDLVRHLEQHDCTLLREGFATLWST